MLIENQSFSISNAKERKEVIVKAKKHKIKTILFYSTQEGKGFSFLVRPEFNIYACIDYLRNKNCYVSENFIVPK